SRSARGTSRGDGSCYGKTDDQVFCVASSLLGPTPFGVTSAHTSSRRQAPHRPGRVPLVTTPARSHVSQFLVLCLLRLPALQHLRPVVELHAQRQPHRHQDFLDFLERLPTKILG